MISALAGRVLSHAEHVPSGGRYCAAAVVEPGSFVRVACPDQGHRWFGRRKVRISGAKWARVSVTGARPRHIARAVRRSAHSWVVWRRLDHACRGKAYGQPLWRRRVPGCEVPARKAALQARGSSPVPQVEGEGRSSCSRAARPVWSPFDGPWPWPKTVEVVGASPGRPAMEPPVGSVTAEE